MIPDAETFPVSPVLVLDTDFLVVHLVGRNLKLYVSASFKRNVFTFRQRQNQLFDEGRYVFVAGNVAIPALNANRLFRNLNLQVLLNGNLAGEPEVIANLTAGEVAFLRRED